MDNAHARHVVTPVRTYVTVFVMLLMVGMAHVLLSPLPQAEAGGDSSSAMMRSGFAMSETDGQRRFSWIVGHEATVVLPLADAMAARLRAAVGGIAGLEFSQPTQANGVFVRLPAGVADAVRESFFFYDWDASLREVRWMCSFDTSESDVDEFAALIRAAVSTV